jgi:ferredoxin
MICSSLIAVVNRFPRPEFESEYQAPLNELSSGRAFYWPYVDSAVLLLLLAFASWFALRRKSRSGLMGIAVFSIFYFGFFRKGCVCSIGSIQNVAAYISHAGPSVSFAVVVFFLLPLVFSLWFGRVFCSSVCPFGAIQEIVQYKPIRVPRAISAFLGFVPYVYLSLAIMFASTGTTFIVCKYDPFITLFRFSGTLNYVLFTIFFLLLSMVVARPYCRFLCPYGVLLKWASAFSKYNVGNTGNGCVGCRLCEEACTVSAINPPVEGVFPEKMKQGTSRILKLILLIPVLVISLGWVVSRLDGVFASMHPTVALAYTIQTTQDSYNPEHPVYWDLQAWKMSGRDREDVLKEVDALIDRFHDAGWYAGGFLGMIIGLSLVRLSRWSVSNKPVVDVSNCVSCGRCFVRCPLRNSLEK